MPLIWNPSLETGVAKIDEQHRELIVLINEFEAVHQAGKDAEAVARVLPRLADYASYHFVMEEKLLASVAGGTDYAQQHLDEHAKFIRLVHDMQADKRDDRRLVVGSLSLFLQLWLEDHIQGTDKILATMLLSRDRSASAGNIDT